MHRCFFNLNDGENDDDVVDDDDDDDDELHGIDGTFCRNDRLTWGRKVTLEL